MAYVDGFVAAVPTANREKYRKHARDSARVFKEHGSPVVPPQQLRECPALFLY